MPKVIREISGDKGDKGDTGITSLYAFSLENGNLYVETQDDITENSFVINSKGEMEVEF